MVMDYYAILGLPRTATPAEIDAAFRSLARKYHPDARPEADDATAQFKLATEAHEVLSCVEKRREYDRTQPPRRRVPVSEVPFPTLRRQAKANRGAAARIVGHRGGVAIGARGGPPRPFGRNVHLCPRDMPFLRRTGWCGLPAVRGHGNGQ